jgi:DNA-binding transcriptional ArsR family regulator
MDIIEYFVREPKREFYVRQLAKLTKKSPTTVSKYLKDYSKKGVLVCEEKFNHLLFRTNLENEEYKDLRNFYLSRYVKNTKSYEILTKKSEVIIFIDRIDHVELMVIGPCSINKFEKIAIDVKLHYHSTINKKLLDEILNGTKIFGTIKL